MIPGRTGSSALILALVCPSCLRSNEDDPLQHDPVPCIGCSRPLDTAGGQYRPYCSDRCRQVARRNSQPREKHCQLCERTFTPPRRDAKYCSPACKQQAYRIRHNSRSLTVTREESDPSTIVGIIIGETPLRTNVRLEGLRHYIDIAKLGTYLEDKQPARNDQPEKIWRQSRLEPWQERMYAAMNSVDLNAMLTAIGHSYDPYNEVIDWRIALAFMQAYGQQESLYVCTDDAEFMQRYRVFEETNKYWRSPLQGT
jgi:hypothetical protein